MILLGLGANLESRFGSPQDTLHACRALLSERGIQIIQSSNIWRSAPVPVSDQPWYYNAVCQVETALNEWDLLTAIADIEDFMGRQRGERNAARVIDLDVLAYNDECVNTQSLTLPHPRMHERAFVLYPLQEIAPRWIHPVFKNDIEYLLNTMPAGQDIECVEQSALIENT